MGTCYNPKVTDNCADLCSSEGGRYFYKGKPNTIAENEIFDYNFSPNERNVPGGSTSYNKDGDETPPTGDDIELNVELCKSKKSNMVKKLSEKTGTSIMMSAAELIIWLLVIIFMFATYYMFESKMPLSNNFANYELSSSSIININNITRVYVLLCFLIIVLVRRLTQTDTLQGFDSISLKEYIKDFLPYLMVSLSAYLFFSGFIRIKFNNNSSNSQAGGFSDYFKNIDTTSLIVYLGIILMLVNSFGLCYLYLRQKALLRKDGYSRSIYWGQISTLLIGGLSAIFIALLGMKDLLKPTEQFFLLNRGKIWILIRWISIITLVIGLIHLINTITRQPHNYLQSNELGRKEDWFSNTTRAEKYALTLDPNSPEITNAIKRDLGYGININDDVKAEYLKQASLYHYGYCNDRDTDVCEKGNVGNKKVCKLNGKLCIDAI